MKYRNLLICASISIALASAGCGGGSGGAGAQASSSAPSAGSLSGVAAVGAAISNAPVSAKCISGPVMQGVTAADGSFNLALTNEHAAPCMLQLVGGNPATTLHGFALVQGRVNVTPFSELILSRALSGDPAFAFAGFNPSTSASIAAGLDLARGYVTTQVLAVTGSSISTDPLTGNFSVGSGDDYILDLLSLATSNAGKTFNDLRQAALSGALLTDVVSAGGSGSGSSSSGYPPAPRPPATTASQNVMWIRGDSPLSEYLTSNQLIYSETPSYQPLMVLGTKSLKIDYGAAAVEFIPNRTLPFMYHDASTQASAYGYTFGLNKTATDAWLVDGLFPGLVVTTPGRGCGNGFNAFYLHELETDPAGRLLKLAADFSYNCGGGDHQVQGVVRYGSSVASVLQRVFAVAGEDIVVPEGRAIKLDGSRSWSPAAKVTSARWTQESGTPLDLSECQQLVCQTYSPSMPGGGGAARLRLEVQTESGLTGSDTLQITILSNADRKTSFEMWGRGFVARSTNPKGGDFSIGTVNGKFAVPDRLGSASIYPNQTSERLNVKLQGLTPTGSILGVDLALMNVRGSPLTAGTYYDPGTGGGFEPFDGTASVVITNTAQGLACGHQVGQMIIGEIDRDPADFSNIRSLSAFVRTNCEVMGVLELESNYARILINHLPSNIPVARISGSSAVGVGGLIQLSSSGSTGIRPIAVKVWRQIYGPTGGPLELVNGGNDAVMPVGAAVPAGTKYVFALDVIDEAGEQGTDVFAVTIN